MKVNPFQPGVIYANDPEDFLIPYKLCGKVDKEILKAKYMQLRKASYGHIVRLGIGVKHR